MRVALPLRPALVADPARLRLGVVWAAIVLLVTAVGPRTSAVTLALVALGAAGQACRAWRRERRRPYRPVAIIGAVVITLAAAAGSLAMAVVAIMTTAAAFGCAALRPGGRAWDGTLTAAIALVAGIAAGSAPLARHELGLLPALVLVGSVLASDATWFLIGTAPRSRFDAPVASTAAIAAVSMVVAAVLVPPFRGASPWVLGAIAAAAAPLGPYVGSAVVPNADATVPALRRVDGFAIAGPLWTLLAAALLDL